MKISPRLCVVSFLCFAAFTDASARTMRKPTSEEEKPNCKLAVRTNFKSGKKKVEVVEIHAFDRADCREKAKQREINSDPEEIDTVKVTFGWRGD